MLLYLCELDWQNGCLYSFDSLADEGVLLVVWHLVQPKLSM